MNRKFVIGIDEAGRGPLAGPVTVAAIAIKDPISGIKYRVFFKNIRDSKKLTPSGREEWFKKLISNPRILIAHSSVGHKTIDKIGIAKAVSRAVKNCLCILNTKYLILHTRHKILLDGSLYAPSTYKEQQTIIKGDEKIPIIAAASIVAKVVRDRKMVNFSKNYPVYDFHIHKGYGTLRHRLAIKKYGLCDIHRRSFCRNIHFF